MTLKRNLLLVFITIFSLQGCTPYHRRPPADYNKTISHEDINPIPLFNSENNSTTTDNQSDSHVSPFLWLVTIVLMACFIPLCWYFTRDYRVKFLTFLKKKCNMK